MDVESHPAPTSGRPVVVAFAILVVLTLVSFAVSHLDLGGAAMAVALAIATVKAGVVAVAFMELNHASTPARITAAVTLSLIALLCAGTIADLGLR